MTSQVSIVKTGFLLLVPALGPIAFGRQAGVAGDFEITLTRPAAQVARPALPSWTVDPLVDAAGSGLRLPGVDVTPDTLLEISTTTGNGTLIGPVGDGVVAGLAYDSNHGILYGSSTNSNDLLTIDPETGATTVIGPFGVSLMHGLGFDSDNDDLYGITNQSSTGGQALW